MTFDEYSIKFRSEAEKKGLDSEAIEQCLFYANSFFQKNIPVIYDFNHFSELTLTSKAYLMSASNSTQNFYRIYSIPKKNGSNRIIEEPLPQLKTVQRWILDKILYSLPVTPYSKAFEKRKNIKDNARFHVRQRVVLKLDIKNFFPSITEGKIWKIFFSLGYTNRIVMMLTKLCCLNGHLPQGAPTSPYLSNLVLAPFDQAIIAFTNDNKIRYTRYADDLTFSGDLSAEQISQLIGLAKKHLHDLNLTLNDEKIKVQRRNNRQIVTGIVVNNGMRAPRTIRRQLRQEMYYIEKNGLDDHIKYKKIEKSSYINHLLGVANFIYSVDKKDKEVFGYLETLKEILNNTKN